MSILGLISSEQTNYITKWLLPGGRAANPGVNPDSQLYPGKIETYEAKEQKFSVESLWEFTVE